MKAMKKLLAVLVVLAMVATLIPAVFADNGEGGDPTPTTPTIKIKAPDKVKIEHTYKIYQIFTGTYADGELNDVQWGENGIDTGAVDATVLEALADVNTASDKDKLAVITQYVDLTTDPVATIVSGATSEDLPVGYYLIEDYYGTETDPVLGGTEEAASLYVVKVAGEGVILFNPKGDVPSLEKKVIDKNDSTGDESGWQDSADYDVGDEISFKLTAKLPSHLADYETYYIQFEDQMEAGLNYVSVDKILVNNDASKDVIDKFTTEVAENNRSFTVSCDDVKEFASANDTIVLYYTGVLTEDAVMGKQGNENKAKLNFSNNPNVTGDGIGSTPPDSVLIFTYQVVVNKIDANGNPLQNAHFKLEKSLGVDENGDDIWQQVGDVLTEGTGDNKNTYSWTRIDDGKYRLTETQTPNDALYNYIEPIVFNVTATHADDITDLGRLDVLTALSQGGLDHGDVDVTSGLITTDIENLTGATLPSTGGIGTTLFYVVGSIMVIFAGVMLVSKKRMSVVE